MRIAIDAMGGDNAPDVNIAGALEALDLLDKDDELLLVGPEDVLGSKLIEYGCKSDRVTIVHAPEVITMDEKPVEAIRNKRKSSIAVMAKLAADGKADAVISAGNTGACVAACQLRMRNLEGINRPGIATTMPTFGGPVTICDVGANVQCKAINLYQYAVMSSIYVRQMYGIESPRIGLFSVGEEEGKGNPIVHKTREMIKADPNLNFIGNIEGRDVFKGVCDVAICEGFMGNVILKLTEGLAEGLFKMIKKELQSEKNLLFALLAFKFKSVMKRIYKKYDYHEYGGAPLLGVNGSCVICHGSSEARTIKNALLAVKKFNTNHINEQIESYLAQSTVRPTDD